MNGDRFHFGFNIFSVFSERFFHSIAYVWYLMYFEKYSATYIITFNTWTYLFSAYQVWTPPQFCWACLWSSKAAMKCLLVSLSVSVNIVSYVFWIDTFHWFVYAGYRHTGMFVPLWLGHFFSDQPSFACCNLWLCESPLFAELDLT